MNTATLEVRIPRGSGDPADIGLVHRFLEADRRGDLDQIRELFHPDAVWRVPAVHPQGGEYRGRGMILRHVIDAWHLTGRVLRVRLAEARPNEDGACATCTLHHGRSAPVDEYLFFRIRDGRIAELRTLAADADAYARFWGSFTERTTSSPWTVS